MKNVIFFFFKVGSTYLIRAQLYELLCRSHPVSSSGGHWRHCFFLSCGVVVAVGWSVMGSAGAEGLEEGAQ